jgi:hypothetical protein
MADPTTPTSSTPRGPHLPALDRLTPVPPASWLGREIEARTIAGEIVLELHSRGGWVARAALDRLRRAFAIETTALTRLVAEIVLRPPDLRHLDAAVSAISSDTQALEGGLRHQLDGLYSSRCATCGASVVVDEFIWDVDASDPSRKSYRCARCRSDGRPTDVDADDVYHARSIDPMAAREAIRARFWAPREDHPLPDDLVSLFPPRSLVALAAIIDRIEGENRTASIQAALRLAIAHMAASTSRLHGHPGRVAQLRVANGRVKPPASRHWRERNAWTEFEAASRRVREFVASLEASGPMTPARVGPDLRSLLDGTANLALRFGEPAGAETFGPPPRAGEDPGPRPRVRPGIRLVLSAAPPHWGADDLAYAYFVSSLAMGPEGGASLPLDALFGTQPRGEWSRDATTLRRALSAVKPVLLPDAEAVIVLPHPSAEALAASVIGGVGAGYRVEDAVIADADEGAPGVVRLALGPSTGNPEREPTLGSASGAPFQIAAVEGAVADIAVAVLQLRGEPTAFERLLGEILVGLDHLGHLRRLVGVTEDGAQGGDELRASGLFGDVPAAAASSRASASASRRATTTVARGKGGRGPKRSVWRDTGAGSDPVRLSLDMIRRELSRRNHPRLVELEEGIWWMDDARDLAVAKAPLSERVEWSVFSLLTTGGNLTERSFRERIARLFRGPETVDAEVVEACLASYRSRRTSIDGTLTTDETLPDRYAEHGTIVGMLVELGHRMGLRAWAAKREQRRRYRDGQVADLLSEPEQRVYLPLVAPGTQEALDEIDCLWYVRGRGAFLFDIEWMAALDEPLRRRGPRIDTTESLVRFLVVPDERTELIRLRLARSPLLRERLRADNWHILRWSNVRRLFESGRSDLAALSPFIGLDPTVDRGDDQIPMFGS